MLNKSKFGALLGATCEVYGKDLSPAAINLYYETLKDYTYEQVNQAFNFVVKTNKYNSIPKPAELIEAIEGKEDERAVIAWESVINAIRTHGYYQSIEFEDKTIHLCIDHLGGWMWLCEQTTDDMKFIAKDFARLYTTFEKHPRKASKKLIGYFEQVNSNKGFNDEIPEPVFIPSNGKVKQLPQSNNKVRKLIESITNQKGA